MKKKIGALLVLLFILAAALSACGILSGSSVSKPDLTEDMIFSDFVGQTYGYSGQPIEPFSDPNIHVDGRYVSYEYFDITFSDNVNVGMANVTITAKPENPSVKGSVTVHFYIAGDVSRRCESGDDLAELLANPNVVGVQLWSDYTVSEGKTVTVPEGKTLSLIYGYSFENYGTIDNYGSIVIRGSIMYNNSRRNTEVTNYGAIRNHGAFEIKDYTVFDDRGVFTSDSTITNGGKIYLRDEDKSFLTDGAGGVRYVRRHITADKILVEECVCRKGYYGYYPTVTLADAPGVYFWKEYFDNTGAGQARVTVTIEERQQYYYGEATASFTIEKGVAEAATLEELQTLSDSGNFREYRIGSLEVLSGENFSLREGDTLILSSGLKIVGSFTNRGTINCDTFRLGENASFSNGGLLDVRGLNFDVAGDFINETSGEINFSRSIQVSSKGSFRNKADLEGEREISLYGRLVNEGTLVMKNAYLPGALTNSGTISFPQGLTLYTGAALLNEASGTATISADSYFVSSFENRGVVNSLGRVSVEDGCSFANTGTFDNRGGVWAFTSLPGVSGSVVIRKYLTDESVLFEAEYDEIQYDRANHVPAFTINGETLPEEECGVRCRYLTREGTYTTFSDTGEIEMTVSIRTRYSRYADSLTYRYKILPSHIRVATSTEFYSATSNANYDRIILDTDLQVYSGSIGQDATLDLNGHKLTVAGTFNVYGALEGTAALPESFIPTEEDANILVKQLGHFNNYGTVTNEGFLYVMDDGNLVANGKRNSSAAEGIFINNGMVITNMNNAFTATGSGTVYRRKKLDDIKDAIEIPILNYDGTALMPVPTVNYQENVVDNARFTITYASNVAAGDRAAITLAVLDPFDPDLYGRTTKNFTIARGFAEVATESDFIAAAEDENYQKITFTANITLRSALTMSDDLLLDLDAYELSFLSEGNLTYGRNCRLILAAGDEARFIKYAYAADEITLTADIGVDAKTELTFTDYTLPNVTGANCLSTVVHMNGYSFLGGLSIVNSHIENFSFTFENSSEEVSTIGSAVGGYAFNYGTCYEETYVTFRNLTVYGVYHQGGSGTAQVVDLSAENCTFLAARDVNNAYAFKIWTSMTASGTYTNCVFDGANAFYVNRGYEYDHDNSRTLPAYFFNNCTLRAYGECVKVSNVEEYYGNALMMERNKSNLYVQINNSYLYSQNGNCIRIPNRTGVYLDCDSGTTFVHPAGKLNVN